VSSLEIPLHLLSSEEVLIETGPPRTDDDSKKQLAAGWERLQQACTTRQPLENQLEKVACNVAWALAQQVIEAGLGNVLLPRGYVARAGCGETYLVKFPVMTRSTTIGAPENEKPLYVLTRRNSVMARLEPAAQRLTPAQIMSFTGDLESGLIEEIACFIEDYTRREELAIDYLSSLLLPEAPEQVEHEVKTTSYAMLGRGRRGRAAVHASEEMPLAG
jgi:hypothetical protein